MEHIQKGILLPKPPTTGGHVDVERLASSFGRALGRFYPFAGRLDAVVVPASNDAASPQCQSLAISLRCGGEGAEFVHAMAPSVTAADITDSLLVPRVVWSFFPLDRLLGADPIIEGSLPLVAAQVTELADSVFIGVSMNHGVADGTTFWQFFNTWSEISRAGTDDVMISAPLPVFDRSFLRSCTVPIPLPFGKLEDVVGQRLHVFPSVQECFLQFSAASVKNLKTKANTEMSGYGNTSTISSLQAVLAHLWRAVCRARRLAPDQKTTYTVLVGCRGRVGGMPASYAGNTVEHAIAKSTAGDILDKGLGWAAWLLNEAVALFDTAYVNEKLASWPQELRFTRLPEMITVTPAELVTGSSPRFDVYGNDFGWGVPVTVRSGAGNKIDGKATVYKGQEGGGSIALEVCLAPEALARLIADVEFMGATTTHA